MNINNLFSNKPVFIEICSKLDNKSLLSFLGTQKSFNEFGKTNKQINEIICNNLGIFDLPRGIESWQKMKEVAVRVIQGKLELETLVKVEDVKSLSWPEKLMIPFGFKYHGDGIIPNYYQIYNDGQDKFFGSTVKWNIEKHQIVHYVENKERGTLKIEEKKKLTAGVCFCITKSFNSLVSVHSGGKEIYIWDLKKHQLLQTINLNMDPQLSKIAITALSCEGTQLFFWCDRLEDEPICYTANLF